MRMGPPSGVIYLLGLQLAARGHILKLFTHYKNYTIIHVLYIPLCIIYVFIYVLYIYLCIYYLFMYYIFIYY